MNISNSEIEEIEKLLLPSGCCFADDAREVIRCWSSTDVLACPGSGKTTVLLAKLKLIADRMPLANGAGVCVLSHTNVAVNEIKSKLSSYVSRLMNYPNYVGTIQTFVDQFVTMPYLKRRYNIAVQCVDNKTYSQHLKRVIWGGRFNTLKYLIKARCGASQTFSDENTYVEKLCINLSGALCIRQNDREQVLANQQAASTRQYLEAKETLLVAEGLLTYQDAFLYAQQAVSELGDEYKKLFSLRFRYVFIDEYQDCNAQQIEVLNKLFDPKQSCVLRIGDIDQAIYSSYNSCAGTWQPQNELSISSTNRYGQEIANTIHRLRVPQQPIISSIGEIGYPPILFVYDDQSICSVLHHFIAQLESHGLTNADGIYKAIGHVRLASSNGLGIDSYWNEYTGQKKMSTTLRYWSMIEELCEALNNGRLFEVEPILRKLLVRILHYLSCRNPITQKDYTGTSLKTKLDVEYFNIYRSSIVSMLMLSEYTKETVSAMVEELIGQLLKVRGTDVISKMPSYFMEQVETDTKAKNFTDTYIEKQRGRKIQFDTVHGVKGETHDATLYLETTYRNGSDIKRILPYLCCKKPGTSPLVDYSRKLVYVGMSRPRYLLCVAVRDSTYADVKKEFDRWEIVDLRNKAAGSSN